MPEIELLYDYEIEERIRTHALAVIPMYAHLAEKYQNATADDIRHTIVRHIQENGLDGIPLELIRVPLLDGELPDIEDSIPETISTPEPEIQAAVEEVEEVKEELVLEAIPEPSVSVKPVTPEPVQKEEVVPEAPKEQTYSLSEIRDAMDKAGEKQTRQVHNVRSIMDEF